MSELPEGTEPQEKIVEPEIPIDENEKDLSYVKNIRKQLIALAFVDNKLPSDKIETQILLDNLAAMERVALTKKRIKSDSEKSNSNEALAVALAKMIREEVDPMAAVKGGGEIPEFPDNVISGIEVPEFEKKDYHDQDYKEFKEKRNIT